MSYNIVVPNANQSPGLFPAQNNTNFQRIKEIIDNNHLFTDSASQTQGYHKQVSMINLTIAPAALVGANAITYSIVDANGQAQLHFYNGVADYTLTPPGDLYPSRIAGVSTLAAGASITIYADPGFRYVGTGWAVRQDTIFFTYYNFLRSGSNLIHVLDEADTPGTNPELRFSTTAGFLNDLQVKNPSGSTRTIAWCLNVSRID